MKIRVSILGLILVSLYLGGLLYAIYYEHYVCNPRYLFNCPEPVGWFFYPAIIFTFSISNASPIAIIYTSILYFLGAFIEKLFKWFVNW